MEKNVPTMLHCATVKYPISVFVTALFASSTAWAVDLPYSENFDSEPICTSSCGAACSLTGDWVNDTADDMDWTVDDNGTTSGSTGPSADHTGGGNYLFTETSGCSNRTANLISPDLDLTDGNATIFEYWYHMYGATMGDMHIDVDPDGGGNGPWMLDVVPPLTDNLNAWQMRQVDLSAFVGSVINVRIRGETGTSFTSDMAIDDVRVFNQWPNDLGVLSVDTPVFDCSYTNAENISITLRNHGSNPQSNFDISYSVNGGQPVTETYTGTLAPFTIDTFTFATPANLAGNGPFNVVVQTELPTDQANSNDASLYALSTSINAFPSVNAFESGPGDWFSGGTNNSWAFGSPDKVNIKGAASGNNAWVNGGLLSTYSPSENSFVETLCGFDLSMLPAPAVRFSAWWNTEAGFDRTRLQASTDNGLTWTTIGALGDPVNWYDDAGGAWAGDSGGYVIAAHELQSLAGEPFVKFRFAFSSDSSVHLDGFAFDDFEVFDAKDELTLTDFSPPPPPSVLPPNTANIITQSFRIAAGSSPVGVEAITVRLNGSLPGSQIMAVNLWRNVGSSALDPNEDVLVGTGNFVGNSVTFAALSNDISLLALEAGLYHVSVDLATNAGAGRTFRTSIDNTADVTPATAIAVSFTNTLTGPQFQVLESASLLPFVDDFDGGQRANRLSQSSKGEIYPTASVAGPGVGMSPSPSPNDGFVQITDSVPDGLGGNITALSAPNMGTLSFPNGPAASALDYWFDLSAFDAREDLVWVVFDWNNANMSEHPLNNVFLSTDATSSWLASLYHFDFTSPVPPGWQTAVGDITEILIDRETNFSSSMVVRFQSYGRDDFGDDGVAIDNIWVGIPQYAKVERIAGTTLQSGTVDGVNGMGTGPITLTYSITNDGHLPVDIGPLQTNAPMGVSNLTIDSAGISSPMAPGESATFDVSFNADIVEFYFEFGFATNDPRAENNAFILQVIGDYGPDIAIARLEGQTIATNTVDDVGLQPTGMPITSTYTIYNTGDIDLNLLGNPDLVRIENQNNALASISVQPESNFLMVDETLTFEVTYTVAVEPDFSFDIVVDNDDFDEGEYRITVGGSTNVVGTPDAGTVEPDAGVQPDAFVEPPQDDSGDCGCSVGEAPKGAPSPVLFFAMTLLAGLYVRRRRLRVAERS